eukprot:473249-Prorocentrum_minimum.AAC.1
MEEVKELSVTPAKMPGVRSVGHVPLATYCRVDAVQVVLGVIASGGGRFTRDWAQLIRIRGRVNSHPGMR